MIVRQYTLKQYYGKTSRRDTRAAGTAHARRFPTGIFFSETANASHVAGLSYRVVLSGRVIDSSSLERVADGDLLRQPFLSTTNMASWRGVPAAVDDKAAILDSCSLKHKRRPAAPQGRIQHLSSRYLRREGAQLENEIEVRTFASSRLCTEDDRWGGEGDGAAAE
jgi:hypothetical protein